MQFAIVIPIADIGGGLPGNALPGFPGYPAHPLPHPPGHPDQGLPHPPASPDQGLPPLPPTPGNPSLPIALPPALPAHPIFHPGTPSHPIAIPPGVIWPPLPSDIPQGKHIVLVMISGVGWRWTVIDTSLTAGWPMPAPK